MQLQADLLGVRVVRPKNAESTALGAAYLAGLGVGYWSNIEALAKQWETDRVFEPQMDNSTRDKIRARWKRAVDRSRSWEQ
jgi:glycerol kinase